MNRPEEAIQRACAEYLRVSCPDLLWYAVPNQRGTRKQWEAALLKALGVRAGVADLAFVLPDGRAAFVELKAPGGSQSPAQRDFQTACAKAGAPYAVVRSLEALEVTLLQWGVPLRARIGGGV